MPTVPDKTARDVVIGTLVAANEHPWVQPPPNMVADAVLAALGITPDTTTDEVRAGLYLLHREGTGHKQIGRDVFRASHVDFHGRITGALGTSAAAAVNALAAKLEDDR